MALAFAPGNRSALAQKPAEDSAAARPPAIDFSGKVKGVWVDMSGDETYNTSKAVTTFVDAIGKAGFTDVYLIALRGGVAMYPSRIVQPSVSVQPALPDPVRAFIERAKAFRGPKTPKGLRVHLVAMPLEAYQGKSLVAAPPENVLRQNPGWLLQNDVGGSRQAGDLFSLDPGVDEARDHCARLAAELAEMYPEADGFQFDGLRYPSEGTRWGYGPEALAAYERDTGNRGVPSPKDRAFSDWRRDRLANLARRLSQAVKGVSPGARVGLTCLAMGKAPESLDDWQSNPARQEALQDWVSWGRLGLADELVLMNNFSEKFDPGAFDAWLDFASGQGLLSKMVVGLGQTENFAEDTLNQFQRALETEAIGAALYSYQQPNIEDVRGPLFDALRARLFGDPLSAAARPADIAVDPNFAHMEYQEQRLTDFERPDFDVGASRAEREQLFGDSRAAQAERGELDESGEPVGDAMDAAPAQAAPVLPDKIKLKSGKEMAGRIVRETGGRIFIRLESGFEASVERSEIQEIVRAQK